MKALLIPTVLALPLLLTSCYVDGVAYEGGGRGYRHDGYYDRHHRHNHRDVHVIDRRPVVVTRGYHNNDWNHKRGYVNPRNYGHRDVIVKKVEVKHVDKYDGHKKKKDSWRH